MLGVVLHVRLISALEVEARGPKVQRCPWLHSELCFLSFFFLSVANGRKSNEMGVQNEEKKFFSQY